MMLDSVENYGYDFRSLALLFFEVIGWSFVYASSVSGILVPWIRESLQKRPFWSHMCSRRGQIMCSLGEECVLSLSMSVHHLIAGGLMFYGYMKNVPEAWVRGIAMEMGYEIVDTYALTMNVWPYSEMSMKKLKVVALIHHIPTLLLIPAMLRLGYHMNSSLQTIGWSLIGAGGISLLCEGFKKTCNLEKELGVWLLAHLFNMIVMTVARFIVFPRASRTVLQNFLDDGAPLPLVAFTGLGAFLLMLFNTFVMVTFISKFVRYTSVFLLRPRSSMKGSLDTCPQGVSNGISVKPDVIY